MAQRWKKNWKKVQQHKLLPFWNGNFFSECFLPIYVKIYDAGRDSAMIKEVLHTLVLKVSEWDKSPCTGVESTLEMQSATKA